MSTVRNNEITLCIYTRLRILSLQDLSLTHQYGAGSEVRVIALGQTLDTETTYVKFEDFHGYVRIQLPAYFYDNIVQITDAQALGVMV